MEIWKFFDITHRYHLICNPLTVEKLDELSALAELSAGSRVLDIACGKAELLVRLAGRYKIRGVGVDLSPYCIRDAEEKKAREAPESDLEFICLNGADYRPEQPGSFDLAVCLGASWIWEGHRGTLRALKQMARPGGLILVGEPFWIKKPPQEYLAAQNISYEDYSTHQGNAATGCEEGLTFLYAIASSQDDWDSYEGLQWYAAARYARSHPEDPDLPVLMERVESSRDSYLRWGRDCLGWAAYLFSKPA